MPAAADQSLSLLTAFGRALGVAALLIGAALALVFAFAAALVVALMILGAALALRLFPGRPQPTAGDLLEARRTPTGWVVEAQARKS